MPEEKHYTGSREDNVLASIEELVKKAKEIVPDRFFALASNGGELILHINADGEELTEMLYNFLLQYQIFLQPVADAVDMVCKSMNIEKK